MKSEYRNPDLTLDERTQAFLNSDLLSPVTRGLVVDLYADIKLWRETATLIERDLFSWDPNSIY